jgi:hypothetical protein
MAVTAKFYGNAFVNAFDKKIDFNSDTIKCALATSSYTPDQDAHDFFNDITNEVVGTGYTAGGATIANPSITYTGGSNTLKLDGDDVSWTTSTITARYAIIYDSTPGTAATNPLISYIDFGADVSTTAGTLSITFDAAGIATVVIS